MKKILVMALLGIWGYQTLSQTNAPLTIKGDMNIAYDSRTSDKPVKGVTDKYKLNINVANSALFQGTIVDLPQIIDGWVSKGVVQARKLQYDVACDVVNPKNPSQTRNVGSMKGVVPINSDGVYQYDKGSLEMSVLPMGNAGGFTSKFGGTAEGKPLARPANWMETLQRNAVNITRTVNGKTSTVVLKKYDKMDFRQHVLAAGPVAIYQNITVNGEMLYDYDKECWFLNNLTMQYADNGMVKIDRLSGTIRWDKKGNEYQFDIRVNEPPANTGDAFDTKLSDESSFFETDTKVPSLTGTMLYKDSKRSGTTLSSQVTINLTGNNITKQQLMALGKIIIFSAIVPINAD